VVQEEAEQLGERILLINRGRLVAEGRPSELIAKLDYSYKVVVDADCNTNTLPELAREEVRIVKSDDGCIVYVKNPSMLHNILAILTSYNLSFSVRKTSLEDVFISAVRGGGV